MNLKYFKTSNEIEDICIVNGLCKILNDNNIDWELINNKSHYLLETEDFNKEDLFFNELTNEDCWAVNSNLNGNEKKVSMEKCNKYFTENIKDIFKIVGNKEVLNKNSTKSISIGNVFFSGGLRASTRYKPLSISEIKRNLSFLGFCVSSNCAGKDNSFEINMILIPKRTNEIIRPFQFKYLNEETKEDIIIKSNKNLNSCVEFMSVLYLETLIEYEYIKDNYEKIIFTSYKKTASKTSKPLADNTFSLQIRNWDLDFMKQLLMKINFSKSDYDVKDVTAKFVVNSSYNNFQKLIQIYSKKRILINENLKGDILNMYNDNMKLIFNNNTVKKIGRGLNTLLQDNRGFEILTKIYGIHNINVMSKFISKLCDEYKRQRKYSLLNEKELIEVIELIKSKQDLDFFKDAVLCYSRIFFTKKTNENKESIQIATQNAEESTINE